MEDCKGIDKLIVLRDVLTKHRRSHLKTLIFCNTVASCRAVEYAINQDAVIGGSFSSDGDDHGRRGSSGSSGGGGGVDGSIHAISYHGDLNSVEREANLELFRNGRLMMMTMMMMMMTMTMMMTMMMMLTL
jgi:superfamily II DNA/RNA helicase